MNVVKLQKLLREREPEDLKLDFKQKLHAIHHSDKKVQSEQWNELIKDILALANGNVGTAGQPGYLIIGVADKLNQYGTRDLYDVGEVKITSTHILNKVNSACSPPLPNLYIKVIRLEGKRILVITIPPTPHLHETTKRLETPNKTIYQENTVFIRRKEGIGLASTAERQAIQIEKQNSIHQKPQKHKETEDVFRRKEVIYYKDDYVTITSKRAIIRGETYTITHIGSVTTKIIPVNQRPGIIIFLLGLVSTLCSVTGGDIQGSCLSGGVIVLILGIIIIVANRSKHAVLISSVSGEIVALTSVNKAYIKKIVTALNDAIAGAEYDPDKYKNFEKKSQLQVWLNSLPFELTNDKLAILLTLSGILVCIWVICLGLIFSNIFLTPVSPSTQTSAQATIPTVSEVVVNPTDTETPEPTTTLTQTPEPTHTNTPVVSSTDTPTLVVPPTIMPTPEMTMPPTASIPTPTFTALPAEVPTSSVEGSMMVDNWEIRVNRIEFAEKITGISGNIEKAAGRFAIVFLTVTNLGLSNDTFVAFGSLEIQNSEGRTYDENFVASGYASYGYGSESGLVLNPDETGHMLAVFDIPKQSDTYTLIPGNLAKKSTGSILLNIP